jgi:hypothetical protein
MPVLRGLMPEALSSHPTIAKDDPTFFQVYKRAGRTGSKKPQADGLAKS